MMNTVGLRMVYQISKAVAMPSALISRGRKNLTFGMPSSLVLVIIIPTFLVYVHAIVLCLILWIQVISSRKWSLLAVLENIVFDEHTREVDYSDKSVTGIYINCFFILKRISPLCLKNPILVLLMFVKDKYWPSHAREVLTSNYLVVLEDPLFKWELTKDKIS